jgi:hypothetical protein
MFELFVASDIARGRIEKSFEPTSDNSRRPARERTQRRRFRSVSAAVLRGLAERLEPSPSS